MSLDKTYSITYTSSGDTIKTGVKKIDDEVDIIYGHINDTNAAYVAADAVVTAAYTAAIAAQPIAQEMIVVDEKAAGTDGGAFTYNDWRTRVLNTTRRNTITGASLASNQVTLPAGTYIVDASCPAIAVSYHKAILYNVTGAAALVVGTSERSASESTSRSHILGQFTLATASVVEIRHWCTSTNGTDGLGDANASGIDGTVEVYTVVKFTKVA